MTQPSRVSSVTNGLDRTLTLTYTDDRLTSVADGNGREVSFTVDSNGNLTESVDAESKSTTYSYSDPGLLTEYFFPANPSTPFVTNEYDSLGRIMSQTPSDEGTSLYYFAGSRSEAVDPLGNSRVMYFNSFGQLARDINALGQETVN
ncbi:MAG: RHS repeat protein, partial [Candidatus Obscuribacterales bacterium]|nr:RHS repeat protein [Candidatus Obscuribacterales bacterium]